MLCTWDSGRCICCLLYTSLIEDEKKHERHASMYPSAVFQLIIAIGIGTIISKLLSLTGMTFPIYIGAMIAAACMRNIGEYSGKFTIYMGEINDIGGISLSLFLGIAMITLKLWQLADLALPLSLIHIYMCIRDRYLEIFFPKSSVYSSLYCFQPH